MVHSLLIARVKDFPDAYYLQRSLSFPYDDESIGEFGRWVKTDMNMHEENAEYYHFELPDKNGDVWDKISAVYDYCILGGRWADKERPCVDTYKNILNRYPDDDDSYSIMVDFQHERISYPKQEGLWNDDDLVYVMDTHR